MRTYRLLLLALALLFAAGHAHQVLGRFVVHHHHGWEMHTLGEVHEHEGGEHHEDHGDPGKDADHMLEHEAAAAVMPALIVPPVVSMHALAGVKVWAVRMPEARVAGIDHPPQLVG